MQLPRLLTPEVARPQQRGPSGARTVMAVPFLAPPRPAAPTRAGRHRSRRVAHPPSCARQERALWLGRISSTWSGMVANDTPRLRCGRECPDGSAAGRRRVPCAGYLGMPRTPRRHAGNRDNRVQLVTTRDHNAPRPAPWNAPERRSTQFAHVRDVKVLAANSAHRWRTGIILTAPETVRPY